MDNLLDGINESYGQLLLEELLSRLEKTIKEFNEEMNSICNILSKKEKERQQVLEMMKSGVSTEEKSDKGKGDPAELTEWEQKIKEIEKG